MGYRCPSDVHSGGGRRLTVEGRIQSRTYTKNLETGPQERVAYEVSVMRPAELSEFVE